MRLIDADKLKAHYAWLNNEEKELFDQIVDVQPTVELSFETSKQKDDRPPKNATKAELWRYFWKKVEEMQNDTERKID